MANIIQIEPPLTIQKVHDKIQEIMNKLNNCECPCPGRCPCLDDPNNKIVAFNNTISCYDGNTFNLNCFIQTLQGWGFEICAGIEVHTGSYNWGEQTHTYQYVGCDELLFPNPDYDDNALRHIAIGCVPKTWKMTEAMYAQLESCCEAGAGQTPEETGMRESGSTTTINSEYACSRTQCCTPTDNHFIYCCDGEIVQYYSETPLTQQQKQDLLDNCLCTPPLESGEIVGDCEKIVLPIRCANNIIKYIQINCLESLRVEYERISNPNNSTPANIDDTKIPKYYRVIKCNGQIIEIEFDPCADEVSDVPPCPGTIVRYCCDGVVKTWYPGDNIFFSEEEVRYYIALLQSECQTTDDCFFDHFKDVDYCPDKVLYVNDKETFAKLNIGVNRYFCKCNGYWNAVSYNCSGDVCPPCPTSTYVRNCDDTYIAQVHKYDGSDILPSDYSNIICDCSEGDSLPFNYSLDSCNYPKTTVVECNHPIIINFHNGTAKVEYNTGKWTDFNPCYAYASFDARRDAIRDNVLLPAFNCFYNHLSLNVLNTHIYSSELFCKVFFPWLCWVCDLSPLNRSYIYFIDYFNNPTYNDISNLVDAITSDERYNDVINFIVNNNHVIINDVISRGNILANPIIPDTLDNYLDSLYNLYGSSILGVLAEAGRWRYLTSFVSGRNYSFCDQVSQIPLGWGLRIGDNIG